MRWSGQFLRCFLLVVLTFPGQTDAGRKRITLTQVLTIGDSSGSIFTQVGDIVVNKKGSIYVTDRYQFKVKKFDSFGIFQKEYGKRGKGASEFQVGPGRIALSEGVLAVSDLGTSRIVLLTEDFTNIKEMIAAAPIVDLAFNSSGNVFCSVLPPTGITDDILMLYSKNGGAITRIPLDHPSNQIPFQMVQLCADRRGNLIAAYSFFNRIMVYDSSLRLHSMFRVNPLPDSVEADTLGEGKFGIVPKGELIQDLAVYMDSLIFVLSGDYSEYPNRDVYVLNYSGDLVSMFKLPRESGLLYIDDRGFLYTRENQRTLLRKYKINIFDSN